MQPNKYMGLHKPYPILWSENQGHSADAYALYKNENIQEHCDGNIQAIFW